MLFNNDLKDNLTLRREGGRRWQPLIMIVILILLAVGLLAVAGRRYLGRDWKLKFARSNSQEQLTISPEQRLLTQVRTLAANNALDQARLKGYEALTACKSPAVVAEIEQLLGKINMELLFSPAVMSEKEEYIVQAGDTLDRIAKKFGTTPELVEKSNALQSGTIRAGDKLRVFKAKLGLTISKSRNDLLLQADKRFFKRYAVGTGKFGKTPVGTFIIADKIPEPPWWKDGKTIPYGDKENVLGTCWMKITAVAGTADVQGYGIHGTWEPETIGKQTTAGCIRLLNSDVEELFLITPRGTRVVITE